MSEIMPGGEPFFFPGGRAGCLLVHGFTGAPKEMRSLGEHLAGEGFSVLGVRLFGHATQPEDMARSRWRDWVACVEDGYHLLRGAADRIAVMGLSMGGTLALLFASRHPVAGVVAMSTPYALPPDPRLRVLRLLSLFQPYVAKGPPDWRDPEAEATHISYPQYPTRAIAELLELLAAMRAALPQVRVPALLINSHGDTTVSEAQAESILRGLGSPQKEQLWLEDSGHVVTRDVERAKVFTAVATFARRVLEVNA